MKPRHPHHTYVRCVMIGGPCCGSVEFIRLQHDGHVPQEITFQEPGEPARSVYQLCNPPEIDRTIFGYEFLEYEEWSGTEVEIFQELQSEEQS